MMNSADFAKEHPATAQGYLLTAQASLEAALRIVSAAIGGLHVALPVRIRPDAPPEPISWAISPLENAIPQLLKATKALDALGVRAVVRDPGTDGLCACDAHTFNHQPEHSCPHKSVVRDPNHWMRSDGPGQWSAA